MLKGDFLFCGQNGIYGHVVLKSFKIGNAYFGGFNYDLVFRAEKPEHTSSHQKPYLPGFASFHLALLVFSAYR